MEGNQQQGGKIVFQLILYRILIKYILLPLLVIAGVIAAVRLHRNRSQEPVHKKQDAEGFPGKPEPVAAEKTERHADPEPCAQEDRGNTPQGTEVPEPGEVPATGITVPLFLQMTAEKNELKCYACYAALFSKFARPLQILMGLDAAMASDADKDWLTRETVMDILQEDVAFEMRECLRQAGGRTENGTIWLPLPNPEKTDGLETYIRSLPAEELEYSMRKMQIEIGELQIYKHRKRLIEDLTDVYEKLLVLAKENCCGGNRIHSLAQETERILSCHGVFAMYYEDRRLTSALAGRFGLVTERQLVYPGLYVQTDGGFSQLSHFSGTRRQ